MFKTKNVTFSYKTVVNLCIAHEINLWPFKQCAGFTLRNSLFGAVKLTKNADFDESKHSLYRVGLDTFGSSDGSGFG